VILRENQNLCCRNSAFPIELAFALKAIFASLIMVWKLLTGISAACLAVAAYFSFIGKNDIQIERGAKQTADTNLAELKKSNADGAEGLKNKETQLVTLTKDLEKLKTDVASAETEVQEKATALELAKKNLEQTSQQLTAIEKKIEEAGDIEKLLAQVNALKKDKEAAEGAVANEVSSLAAAQEAVSKLLADIEKTRGIEARSRKGELDPEFTARIAQAFSDWGFAVLNKGNSGGVVANAVLDVKRGKDIVAKLKVRNVEQGISVADIVPGSMKQGDVLRSGDVVVPGPVEKKEAPAAPAPVAGAAPAAPAAAPGAAPAMGADPFGAPAAAPMAPAAADPFGAPAAPAPGAAPAAPAAADPFGAPPAPAGEGTKASPSTADPFAK